MQNTVCEKITNKCVQSYLGDGFTFVSSGMDISSDVKYYLLVKGSTNMLVMTNDAYTFEKKIRVPNDIAKYATRKFYEFLFNHKIQELRKMKYFVRILARIEKYTLAMASKTTYEGGLKTSHMYILHDHYRNKYGVSITAERPI